MPHTILIVDDEPAILELQKWSLQKAGYNVLTAPDGLEGRRIIETAHCDLLISDIRMPRLNGVELLRWVKENKPSVKVILMTGFSELVDSKTAIDLGCEDLLSKPVSAANILQCAQRAFASAPQAATETGDYRQISIEDFILAEPLKCSIHLMLPGGRAMQVATSAEELDLDQIANLKSKGVTHLWIRKADFDKHYGDNTKLALLTNTNTSPSVPTSPAQSTPAIDRLIQDASQLLKAAHVPSDILLLAKDTFLAGLDAVLYKCEDTPRKSLVDGIANSPFGLHAAVGSLSAIIAAQVMEWSSKRNTLILATGSYLRDCGLTRLPVSLQTVDGSKLTEAQLKMYLDHPRLGFEELSTVSDLPREVSLIVLQHHENPSGTGFPGKLRKGNIFPLATVAHAADLFSTKLLRLGLEKAERALQELEVMTTNGTTSVDQPTCKALRFALTSPNLAAARSAFKTGGQRS